jgi:O-antigen ligase
MSYSTIVFVWKWLWRLMNYVRCLQWGITVNARTWGCARRLYFSFVIGTIPFIRSDFISVGDPTRLNVARWFVVALAASVPLGSATMNIMSACLLLAVIVAGGYRQHVVRIRSNLFAIASISLLLLLAFGTTWSTGPSHEAIRMTEKHARILLGVFAVITLLDARWQRRALMGWMAAMALTLVLSYVHSIWAFPLARATREAVSGDHYIFKHHITQNVMMSVFVVAALCEALRARQQGQARNASLWLAMATLAVFNIVFFVAGRTGHLTLLINLVVICVLLLRGRRALVAGAVMGIVMLVLATQSEHFRTGISAAVTEIETRQETGAETSVGQRLGFAEASLTLIAERPLIGWGTGSYAQEYCRIVATPQWCKTGSYNPHNQFLFFGVQLGLLGLVAYLLWFASAAWMLRRQPPLTRALGFCVLATLLVHSMLDSTLYIVTEGAWYPLMLGILTATTESTEPMAQAEASISQP